MDGRPGLRHGLHPASPRQFSANCGRIRNPAEFIRPQPAGPDGRHGQLPPLWWQFSRATQRQETQHRRLLLPSGDNCHPEVERTHARSRLSARYRSALRPPFQVHSPFRPCATSPTRPAQRQRHPPRNAPPSHLERTIRSVASPPHRWRRHRLTRTLT